MGGAEAWAAERQQAFVGELMELLRIPSVSAMPEHAGDCAAAAEWVAAALAASGVDAAVTPPAAGGSPLVVGRRDESDALPTVLVYGHYDVQPPDPLELWRHPPFSPHVEGDDVFARGATDDKGQLWAILCGVRSLIAAEGALPCNLRVLVEGEEESGGRSLRDFVARHPDAVAADAAWLADAHQFAPGWPAIYTATRGIVYAEVRAFGAATDLHSGTYGGVAPNPLLALCQALGACRPWNGAVDIPGFYDGVLPPPAAEAAAWRRLPFDEAAYMRQQVGASALPGEPGYSVFERVWARPTFEIHGISGGFVGPGAKTVIPAAASAKVSMRLVLGQEPHAVAAGLASRMADLCPSGVRFEVDVLHADAAVQVPAGDPAVEVGRRALRHAFGREPALLRLGGSLPALADIVRTLGVPAVLTGFGRPDDRPHAPNEKLHLPDMQRGVMATIAFLRGAAALPRTGPHGPPR